MGRRLEEDEKEERNVFNTGKSPAIEMVSRGNFMVPPLAARLVEKGGTREQAGGAFCLLPFEKVD